MKFDKKLSLQIDKAVRAMESDDKTRQKLGKIWKAKLEKKIWGEDKKEK